MKPSFTNNLKSLILGGALAASVVPQIQAAVTTAQGTIADRVDKVREAAANAPASVLPASDDASSADIMWWRNGWGNGGWHNWHNGWRNGGGWGNWHNW